METPEEKIKNQINKIENAKDFEKVLIIANFDSTMEYPLSISKALYNLSPSVEIFYTAFKRNGVNSNENLKTIDNKNPIDIDKVKTIMNAEKKKLPDETRFPKIVRHAYDIQEHTYNLDGERIYDAIIIYWNPENQGVDANNIYLYFIDIAKKLLKENGSILVWFPEKPDSFDSEVFENIVDDDNFRIVSGFKTLLAKKYINLLDDKHSSGPFIDGDLSSIVKGVSEASVSEASVSKASAEEEYRFYREVDGEQIPITEIDVSKSEGVFQREFAITNKNKEKIILGTHSAGPCVIVCMRNRETTDTFLGHIDCAGGVSSIKFGMKLFPRKDTDVYVVGGDRSSKYLIKRILQLLNEKMYNIKFLYILWPSGFKIGDEIYDTKGANFGINCITGETYCFVDIDPKYNHVVDYYPMTNKEDRMKLAGFRITCSLDQKDNLLMTVTIPDAKKGGARKKKTRKRCRKQAVKRSVHKRSQRLQKLN